jgi:hypothetical protein
MIAIGTRVKCKAEFLRSVRMFTGPMPFARGTVSDIQDLGGGSVQIATVDWDDKAVPAKVNVKNLVPVGKVELS